ncbi:probable D-lactate dehydrogenase, mitochondrial isoform X1 [Apostichopus japonicus]|uniref:probable D-lactate dehydrogenase, mitochondrial isoform X1 n=2 Tax=Stichopus japonicus TaxID=307972 RepID=UPI003AB582AF
MMTFFIVCRKMFPAKCLKRLLSSDSLYPKFCSSEIISADIFKSLQSIVGDKNISKAEAVCSQHSHDESYYRGHLPAAVVWPQSVQEVSHVVKICHKHRIPMIPFGTGTGLEGGVLSEQDGCVAINLTKMEEITGFHPEDLDVSVQPGVTRHMLNNHLKSHGLHFPIDPGADASLCGMCATGASGTNAVRYGTMKENVLNMEVVLADGTIVHTAGKNRRTKKSSAGYNLTNLFVGSEGTLGLITEATLRVYGIPEKMVSAVCSFDTVKSAVDCVAQVMQSGIPMARIEFLDDMAMNCANKYSHLEYRVAPTLFLEFQGSESSVEVDIETVGEIVKFNNGSEFQYSQTMEERNKLWKARHEFWYSMLALRPGGKGYSTDVCVPISELPDVISYAKEELSSSNLLYSIVGHVGDGNFHCGMNIDMDDEDEVRRVKEFSSNLVKRALAANGTCTGEHGVGLGKRKYLIDEFAESGVMLMAQLKRTMDPYNLLNPGKVLLPEYLEKFASSKK